MSPNLQSTLNYLAALTRRRLAEYLGVDYPHSSRSLPSPLVSDDEHPYTSFVQHRRLTADEFVALAVALAPHLQPLFFDNILKEFKPDGSPVPAFGGLNDQDHRRFVPTGETVQFLLAGEQLDRRLQVQQMFGTNHFFVRERIVYLNEVKPGEPFSAGKLILDPEFVELFTLGYITPPKMSSSFPAQRLTTELVWDDLVLSPQTQAQLGEVSTWIQHNDTLMYDWKMYRRVKPGFRVLFHGPPGTGKTMAASLLGKTTGHDVYRIDLAMIMSKFIGETEKNLSNLLDKAENKNWILFFDEADALFGKRTHVRDAHDRYANLEVSYLLQRIEEFSGLSILASNFISNMDDAFTRRFQSVIYFPMPRPEERLQIWLKNLPPAIKLDPKINLSQVSVQFELSGSNIVNVMHYCCLKALENKTNLITLDNLLNGINRELQKEKRPA